MHRDVLDKGRPGAATLRSCTGPGTTRFEEHQLAQRGQPHARGMLACLSRGPTRAAEELEAGEKTDANDCIGPEL